MLLEAGTGATLGDGDDGNSDDDDASIGRIKKRYSQMLEADDDDSRGLSSSNQISMINSIMSNSANVVLVIVMHFDFYLVSGKLFLR